MKSVKLIEPEDILKFLKQKKLTQTQFIRILGINYYHYKKIMNGHPPTVLMSTRIRRYIEENSEKISEKYNLIVWQEGKIFKGYIDNYPGTDVEANNLNDLFEEFKLFLHGTKKNNS